MEPVRLPERELQAAAGVLQPPMGERPAVRPVPHGAGGRAGGGGYARRHGAAVPAEGDAAGSAAFSLEVGGQYDVAALCSRLIAGGYTRTEQVEGAGQFALRGGILDVFSPGEERPLRCEFFDDELDSMGEFEVATQRRVLNRQRAHILPAGELLPFAGETTAADAAERMEEAAGTAEEGARRRAAAAAGRCGAAAAGYRAAGSGSVYGRRVPGQDHGL